MMGKIIARVWLVLFVSVVCYRLCVPTEFVSSHTDVTLGTSWSPLGLVQKTSFKRFDGDLVTTDGLQNASQFGKSLFGLNEGPPPISWNPARFQFRRVKTIGLVSGVHNAICGVAAWISLVGVFLFLAVVAWAKSAWLSLVSSGGGWQFVSGFLFSVVKAGGLLIVVGMLLWDAVGMVLGVSQVSGQLTYHLGYWSVFVATAVSLNALMQATPKCTQMKVYQ